MANDLKLLVCIKQVPDTNRVEVDPVTGVLKREGVDSKMNPYDLYALETTLRLKEQFGGTVTVLTMGPPQAEAVLREAYSMGADTGILISDRRFGGADVLATSYTISQAIRQSGRFDLILCGKQTTDGDTAQVGCEISEWLGLPCAANVSAILKVEPGTVTVQMNMPSTMEVAEMDFPCLLCVDKGIYQPRLPSYIKKQAAKDRPITVLSLNDLADKDAGRYGLNGSPTQVQRIFPPEVNNDRTMWHGGAEELADKLADELTKLKFVGR